MKGTNILKLKASVQWECRYKGNDESRADGCYQLNKSVVTAWDERVVCSFCGKRYRFVADVLKVIEEA